MEFLNFSAEKCKSRPFLGGLKILNGRIFVTSVVFLSERQIDQKIKTLWWKIERAISENGLKMASSKTAFFRRFSPAGILLETRRGEIERADSESGLRKPFCKNCYFRVSHHLVKPVQEIRNRHFCDLRRFCGCVKNAIFVTSVFLGFCC